MNKELAPHPGVSKFKAIPFSLVASGVPSWQRSIGVVLAGSALMAICAHFSVPLSFTPVPLTLAPFAVLVLGLLLRPGLAASTLGAYLIEGAIGLPVFTPVGLAPGGVGHLLGPTGGYLLSYPMAAALIALLVRRTDRSFVSSAWCAAAGSLLILFCGAVWLTMLTHGTAASSFRLGILPFLPGDALKVAAAAALSASLIRLRRRVC